MVVHTFLWVVSGNCLRAGFMESRNFFVLRPIQVKIHIRTRLIESFPMTYWLWWCAEEKWRFTPVHTLRQLKRDEGLFPPLWISLAGRNVLKNLPRQIFSVCVKFGGNPGRNVDTLGFYTHTHTRTHTHTYTNEIVYEITSCDTRALHGSPVLSFPLEAHHKAQSSEIFLSFFVKNLKSCNFFSFWPILLKLHIYASKIESFPTTYGLSNSAEDKW